MKKKRIVIFIMLLMALCCQSPEIQAQCAMCRASVESNLSSGESSIGAGLNKGILFLLSIPYLAIATIAVLWYRASTRERDRKRFVARILKMRLG